VKRIIAMLFVLLGATSFAQQPAPEIPFDSVPNFFKLPPDVNFGEVGGVALNSKGHIFVFTRSNSANGPSNDLSVIDAASRQVIKKIPVGQRPWGVAVVDAVASSGSR